MPGMDARPAHVLVADDIAANRDMLQKMLEWEGYRVVCAEDGEQALEDVRSQPIDLALLDVMMPKRTGFSACRAIKSAPETRLIPVVMVTGLTDRDDRIQGIECGAAETIETMRKEIRRGWWDAALVTELEKLVTQAVPSSSGRSKQSQPPQEAGLGGVS